MTKSLHVRLPDDLHAALTAEADRIGISLNALIAVALRQWQETRARGLSSPST
jgi:predicted HicB family RNase H-like nuclease